ncbi:PREDICTED: Hermansky-Pudlak syndrome 5 protein homolog [Polistes canadensis]|uniref:Hermansky-Pudlak syndrome 5 protein homolog n=1 Tax=Polistes canadensis TaxID=91411 RepID=UPI000718E076|nr:PREDICTED: Hermansky-Pudlak syndrome 5 protein homolog [Polistes canadensis]
MQEFSHILSECEEINQVLHKPINSTQRIKYTCLNVSQNYIILGSTSGSIYLFNREPCAFQQLIPLSEGIVSLVSISPDEKIIALATTRGIVCLVTLKPTIKLVATSNEHAYEKITCLCWNDNSSEIYVGDGTGKVSVIILSVFTVNGMFQSPSHILMNLDSSIVQLNFSSSLLLISTLTRCYICDTVHEQYKQIGNKGRNGEFGACFYKMSVEQNVKTSTVKKGQDLGRKKSSFSLISEGNSEMSELTSMKIFCARPSSRFWEISANGVVLKTHQFKELLAVPPMKIHRIIKEELEQKKNINQTWTSQSINFPQLFVIASKYLFSYTFNGLYILDPVNPNIVLWNNEFTNITMVDVIDNKIYLMISDNEFHCLTLYTLDELILHLYYTNQYYDCLETCITYKSQLLKLINDQNIGDIYNIETNQRQKLENDEISVLLQPLISILKSNLNLNPIKLESGIVVVNSGNLKTKFTEDQQNKLTTHQQISSSSESITQISSVQNTSSKIKNILEINSDLSLNEDLIRKIQNDIEAVCILSSSIKTSTTEKEFEKFILDIRKEMNNIERLQKTIPHYKDLAYDIIQNAKINCTKTFLTNVSIELLRTTMNAIITDHFMGAFVLINISNYNECTCGFPLPTDRQIKEPSFLEIGKALLDKFVNKSTDKCIYLCNRVPYMWREYITLYMKQQYAIEDILNQCLLTGDIVTLSIILPMLDANQWKLITKYLKIMNDKKCLSCEQLITLKTNISSINWNGIILEVMKKDGPDTAMVFLKKLETLIPFQTFDKSIFQSLIFTKILHHHGLQLAVNFNKCNSDVHGYNTMCSTKIKDQLIEVLKKDIARIDNKNILSTGAHHWGMRYKSKNKSLTCPCCTLSLQTSVLLDNNGIAIFPCGHTYHVVCMIEKKLSKCNLH